MNEQALKARLKHIAKEFGKSFDVNQAFSTVLYATVFDCGFKIV